MSHRRGAAAVAGFLAKSDVPYLFMGPVGHTQLELFHAVHDRDDVDVVMTKHELVAGHMAAGFAAVSGTPGVASSHTTPGLGNAMNGLVVPQMNSIPVVHLQTDVAAEWRGRHAQHSIERGSQWGGAYEMAEPVTKGLWDVARVDNLEQAITQAFRTAVSERPGATLVNLPMDVLAAETDLQFPSPDDVIVRGAPVPDGSEVERAADLLIQAERPVLLAGGGTVTGRAYDAVRNFAETLSVPVATTDSGMGAFPETHDLSVGVVSNSGSRAAVDLVNRADLVVAVGTGFREWTTGGWTYDSPFRFPEQALVQVDIEPTEIGRNYPVDVGVVGDAGQALDAVTGEVASRLDDPAVTDQSYLAEARTAVDAWREDVRGYFEPDDPLTMGAVIREANERFPDDTIVVTDSGRNRGETVAAWTVRAVGSVVMDTGNSAMGFGPSAALGAKLAAPDREVVSIAGDGGFVMVNQALATAVEYDIPVTWIVLNDRAFSSLSGIQEAYFGGETMTKFRTPDGQPYDIDYVAMAEAYGVDGQRVSDPATLSEGLEAAVEHDGPYLLDALVTTEGSGVDSGVPWVQPGRSGEQ